jgi:RHS repeat-associated protein
LINIKKAGSYDEPYRFGGKIKDEESGLNYFEARYYDNDVSIFINVDPMWYKYPSLTSYHYCGNNPISYIDPDGQDPRKVTITVRGVSNGNTYIAKTYPQRSSRYFIVPAYNITVSGTNNEGKEVSQTWQVLRFMPFLNENPQATGYKTKTGEMPIMAGLADKREQTIQSYLPDYEIHNTFSEENGGFVITGGFMIHDGPDNLQSEAGMWGAAGCMEVVGENGFSTMKEFIFSISGSENTNIEKGLQELVNTKNLWLQLEGTPRPPVNEYEQ